MVTIRRHGRDERRLLGELLLEAGLLSSAGLQDGLEAQGQSGGRLGCQLLRRGHVDPSPFHLFLDQNLPSLCPELLRDLRDGSAAAAIPARLAHHYGVAPVRVSDGVLDLAVASVEAIVLKPAVEALTGLRVEPIVCPPGLIASTLDQIYPGEVEPGVIFRPAGDHVLVLTDPSRGIRPDPLEELNQGASSSAWLRGVLLEAFERCARRIEIAPRADRIEITLTSGGGQQGSTLLPRGAYAGVSMLLDGLARVAARGRILPRDGRFTLRLESEQTVVSVLALPGLLGYEYRLDLREESLIPRTASELARSIPGLTEAVERLAAGRGTLLLASPEEDGAAAGLMLVLELLGDRLPRRAGAWGRRLPGLPRFEEVAGSLDLAVGAWPEAAENGSSGWPQRGKETAAIAIVKALDAGGALDTAARRGGVTLPLAGVLATRLLEALCSSCRVEFDVADTLALLTRDRSFPRGPFWTSPGCPSCRGSGVMQLEVVGECAPGGSIGPNLAAFGAARQNGTVSRMDPSGMIQPALHAAAQGRVDVKEALRLLHEQH